MSSTKAAREPEEVALLTGPRAASVLAGALAPAGQQLLSWEVHSVHHRPGAGVSVGYTAVVVSPSGSRSTEADEAVLSADLLPMSPSLP